MPAPQQSQPSSVDSGTTEDKTAPAADNYAIPKTFESMPKEWRTATFGDDFAGYAALFDPVRREVIVEQCQHPGYIDPNTGTPLDTMGVEFCLPVLWAKLESLNEQSAMARNRTGELVELTLAYDAENSQPQLALNFENHEVTTVPGSKNDLFQDMERAPEIAAQKRKMFELVNAENVRRRQ